MRRGQYPCWCARECSILHLLASRYSTGGTARGLMGEGRSGNDAERESSPFLVEILHGS